MKIAMRNWVGEKAGETRRRQEGRVTVAAKSWSDRQTEYKEGQIMEWEYKVIAVDASNPSDPACLQDNLNQAAADAWQLVEITFPAEGAGIKLWTFQRQLKLKLPGTGGLGC